MLDRWPLSGMQGRLLIAGTASLALYAALAAAGDLRAHLERYLIAHGLLFLLYAWVMHRLGGGGGPGGPAESMERTARTGGAAPSMALRLASPARIFLVFAVLFRAVLVFSPPSLSDDLHRYVWDGRVQAAGINPYRHAPDAAELRPLRDAGWERINHREVKTIYPPAAEALFLAMGGIGLGTTGFKAIFCLFDLGVALALGELLRRSGRSPLLAAVYSWNPLVVVEVASSGHSDPVGLFLLVISIALIIGERRVLSIAAYAGSFLFRILPIAFAPIYARRLKVHHMLLGGAILLAGVAPYAAARADLASGLRAYAENWDYNSIVFPALRTALDRSVDVERLKGMVTVLKGALGDPAWCQVLYRYVYPAPFARALLLATMIAGVFVISFRVPRPGRGIFLASSLLLVLSPTLHPWYVLWIIPFAAAERSVAWIVFSGLAPLSYLSLRAPDGRVPASVLAIEWGVPALVALTLWARSRLHRSRRPR